MTEQDKQELKALPIGSFIRLLIERQSIVKTINRNLGESAHAALHTPYSWNIKFVELDTSLYPAPK